MYDVIMLDCVPVRYDKDLLVNNVPEQNSLEWERMSYGQKHPDFSEDCEYRLVLRLGSLLTMNIPDYITINLGMGLEYAEIMEAAG